MNCLILGEEVAHECVCSATEDVDNVEVGIVLSMIIIQSVADETSMTIGGESHANLIGAAEQSIIILFLPLSL